MFKSFLFSTNMDCHFFSWSFFFDGDAAGDRFSKKKRFRSNEQFWFLSHFLSPQFEFLKLAFQLKKCPEKWSRKLFLLKTPWSSSVAQNRDQLKIIFCVRTGKQISASAGNSKFSSNRLSTLKTRFNFFVPIKFRGLFCKRPIVCSVLVQAQKFYKAKTTQLLGSCAQVKRSRLRLAFGAKMISRNFATNKMVPTHRDLSNWRKEPVSMNETAMWDVLLNYNF